MTARVYPGARGTTWEGAVAWLKWFLECDRAGESEGCFL